MKSYIKFLSAIAGAFMITSVAHAKCDSEVVISEMNWPSAQILTEIAKFIIENGYECEVKKVPTSTVPSVTSMAETGKPDILIELWYNSAQVFAELERADKAIDVNNIFTDGGEEGWWIPQYLADKHPELKTLDGILANPELVGGKFHNCPTGWGCRIANDNLIKAHQFDKHKMDVFNHGSGETLAASIAAAYADEEPWFGYYWAPTSILGKYPMVKVDTGPYVAKVHTCNQSKDCQNPGKSAYPAAKVITAVSIPFAKGNPDVTLMLSKMELDNGTLNRLLAWQENEKASAGQAAARYLAQNKSEWSQWLNLNAKDKLAKLLN